MKNRRFNPLRFLNLLRRPLDGDGGEPGGAPAADTGIEMGGVTVADVSAPTTVSTPEGGAPAGDAPDALAAAPAAPKSMHEAMFGAADQPRGPDGRFLAKAGDTAAAPGAAPAPAQGAQQPGQQPQQAAQAPSQPANPADKYAMPDGLKPEGQRRFQALANENKELTEYRARVEPQFEALQETFQTNGVQREQFDLAMGFIGAFNRGDFAAARQILEAQIQAVSIMSGQPVSVDLLHGHTDLRQAVQNLQITPEHALEIARGRMQQQGFQAQQQRQTAAQQQQQDEQRRQQETEQAVAAAQGEVDKLCRQLQTSDIDYVRIEPLILEAIQGGLLQGLHPQHWAVAVKRQYELIKKVGGASRTNVPATPTLRPTGTPTPKQAPTSAYEAMWGKPQPSA